MVNFASLFNCTPVDRASDSLMDPTESKLSYFSWLGTDLVLSGAWSFGVQLAVFFCSGISVVLFDTLGISRCHSMLFLWSPNLSLIIGLICNLFVFLVGSLMG